MEVNGVAGQVALGPAPIAGFDEEAGIDGQNKIARLAGDELLVQQVPQYPTLICVRFVFTGFPRVNQFRCNTDFPCQSRYPEFLRSLCSGDPFFPLIVFGAGMANPRDFTADRDGIRLLQSQSTERAGFGYEITWKEKTFRRLGAQRIPATVAFTTREDYVRFLKKQSEVWQFVADCGLIQHQCPELIEWVKDRPLKMVTHAGVWQELLNVCVHLRNNPRPNCYLRELPVVVDIKIH